MDNNQIYEKLLRNAQAEGNLNFFKNETPAYAIIHSVLTGEMTDYLDYIGIPYTVYSLKNKKNNLILFGQKNFDNMIEIEKGTRIRLGLEIETKDDLKMAIFENNKLSGKRDMISCVNGLTEYEAKRVCELMSDAHLVAVEKMYPDFTYEVATHKKNKLKIQKYLIQAMLEELIDTEKVRTKSYFYSQDHKLDEVYRKISENDLRENMRIMSGLNTETYIDVTSEGFSYTENGNLRFSQPYSDTYLERLDIALHLIEYPVVVSASNIAATPEYSISNAKAELAALNLDQLSSENNEIIQRAATFFNNSEIQDGIVAINDSSEIAEKLNESLSAMTVFDERAGVTLEYMMESDYGYDLNAAIELANGKYINITDKEPVAVAIETPAENIEERASESEIEKEKRKEEER